MTKLVWTDNTQKNGNFVLLGEDFYLSYLPRKEEPDGNVLGEETALVKKSDLVWCPLGKERIYALFGDYREEFEEAFPLGFLACLEVYRKYEKDRTPETLDLDLECPFYGFCGTMVFEGA